MADNKVDVLHISIARGKPRSHRSLIQDTARAPRISTYAASPEGEKCVQVCALEEGDTWMTPYSRYIAYGILPAKPGEGKRIKKNSARYTLVDEVLFRHGFTHPIRTCVSGDECTRIMSELHEGICGSHVRGKIISFQGDSCRVLLAISEGRLCKIRPAMQAVPDACRLA